MNNPDQLVEILQSILDVACACLEDTPNGLPDHCFISHADPPSDCCRFLSIWTDNIRPTIGGSNEQSFAGQRVWDRCENVGGVMDVNLKLMRDCFPVLLDSPTNPFPDPSHIQEAAENLLIDAWTLRCCVMSAHDNDILLPDDALYSCLEVGWGDMVPIAPLGGCAGWLWKFAIELSPCC